MRISGAKDYPFMVMLLIVSNQSKENIMFFPENILVLDANSTILNMFWVLASNVKESAERRFNGYSQSSANYVASVQAHPQPAYYTVSGTTQSYGSGSFYSYGNYGNYDYSGTSYSNYTVTPAPDFSGVGAALGRMIGLAIARSDLNKSLKVAENTYRTAFSFGEIPQGTNRVGLIYFDTPMYFPLQIKLRVNGNDFYYKWDWETSGEDASLSKKE